MQYSGKTSQLSVHHKRKHKKRKKKGSKYYERTNDALLRSNDIVQMQTNSNTHRA